ncbi:Protein of unknown function (DUF1635 [Striga hermonthica]|uniref:Uncharacterized protein n=1 Tax=Striga hermonthica TaxID=68872 RepID=A0A9N7NXF2_STRHE|nr:Protein of unknown function (DUF1635 [Striga hermonthica]
MDNQRSLQLNWTTANYFPQEKSMEELRQSLILTMELEDTRLKAQQELKLRDEQIAQLKELLSRALKERDQAQEKCHKAILEKLMLQQQIHHSAPNSGVSSVEDDPRHAFSSSDCDESIVSSPRGPAAASAAADLPVAPEGPLPEKGRLLQAVMKAGPLLQTLLLAGPLPQWRHPPPPLEAYQIPPPPVVVPAAGSQDPMISFNNCGRMLSGGSNNYNRKRGFSEGSETSSMAAMGLKYQRVVLH